MKNASSASTALRLLLAMTLLCGGVYPLLITILAHTLFPDKATGSLITLNGRVAGSRLIAQPSPAAGYFHPRPSACSYSTLPGSASNFAVSSAAFRDSVTARQIRFRMENELAADEAVPLDMLCASASGLDPHISPAAAKLQLPRIARDRHLPAQARQQLEQLVAQMTEPRQLGFLGEPRINVFALNFMLDNSDEFNNFYGSTFKSPGENIHSLKAPELALPGKKNE